MKHRHVAPKRTLLASALLLALGPVYAQTTTTQDTGTAKEQDSAQQSSTPPSGQSASAQNQSAAQLDTVTIQGIRGSLTSSMNMKRDAQGVVDGIVAEDIGKFPDT